jgi:GNAT superfamily N-acetyltransferase
MTTDYELPFPQYRCPTCGKDLPLGKAKMTVTCGEHVEQSKVEYSVRQATPADRQAIELICDRAQGETEVDVFGSTFDVLSSVNLVAEVGSELAGVLSFVVDTGELSVVLLSVYPEYQGTGVGSGLLRAVEAWAAERGLPFMRVAASNDDAPFIYFLQRQGFVFYEVAIGEIADRLGGAVPGFSGIPMRDELRLRKAVCTD